MEILIYKNAFEIITEKPIDNSLKSRFNIIKITDCVYGCKREYLSKFIQSVDSVKLIPPPRET